MVRSELSIGPLCVARSNPTHQLTDPTQLKPLQVETFGPNPTQQTIEVTDAGVYYHLTVIG